jgi:hypothetical protein
MPVEIRELVIRAVTTLHAKEDAPQPPLASSVQNTDAIIAECVRQVISILKKKEER